MYEQEVIRSCSGPTDDARLRASVRQIDRQIDRSLSFTTTSLLWDCRVLVTSPAADVRVSLLLNFPAGI